MCPFGATLPRESLITELNSMKSGPLFPGMGFSPVKRQLAGNFLLHETAYAKKAGCEQQEGARFRNR
jgi:hypothetical protein